MASRTSLSGSFNLSLALQRSSGYDELDHSERLAPQRTRSDQQFNGSSSGSSPREMDVSCTTRCLLASVTYGPEAVASFLMVYGVLSLQYLGVPVYLVSMDGIVCGITSIFLIPTMGSFADRGHNPKKRRLLVVLFGLSTLIIGFSILAISSRLKADSLKYAKEEFDNSAVNSSAVINNYPGNETGQTLNGSIIPFSTKDNKTPASCKPNSPSTISTSGILAIVGFILLDIGFDSSLSQVKTFLVDSVPDHQSTQILASATSVSAVCGIINTSLGMFDLPSVLGPMLDMDEVAATFIALSVYVIILISLASAVTVFTVHWVASRKPQPDERRGLLPSIKTANSYSNISEAGTSNLNLPQNGKTVGYVSSDVTLKASHTKSFQSSDSRKSCCLSKDRKSTFLSQWAFIQNKRLLLIYVAAFLSFGCLNTTAYYSSNIVTVEVLKGDPFALPGTEAYSHYKEGLRVSSTGTLLSYLTYFAASLVNSNMTDLIGAKLLFLLSNALLCAIFIVYRIVQTTASYYAYMAFYGVYRCSIYTHPFLLATRFARTRSRPTRQENNHGGYKEEVKEDNLAKVISLLGFLFTLNFLIVSIFMGPWMDAVNSA